VAHHGTKGLYLRAATLKRLADRLGLNDPLPPERKKAMQLERWKVANDKRAEQTNKANREKRAKITKKRERADSRIPGWEFVRMMADVEKAPPDKLKAMQHYLKKSEDRFRMSTLQRFRLSYRISARLRLCFKRALLA
jgi:hypothetical protein